MAVPESTPPVPQVPNNVRLIAQTVVPGGAIHRAVLGRFRHASRTDTVLVSESHIFLATNCHATERELQIIHKQPVHGIVLDMQLLQPSTDQNATNNVQIACQLLFTGSRSSLTKAYFVGWL